MELRKSLFLLLCAMATFSLMWLPGCEPEEPPRPPGNPVDLQFEGLWIGNTSQLKLVEFEVQNIEEHAYITRCRLSYSIHGDWRLRDLHNVDGLCEIISRRFSFALPDESIVTGTFADTTLLEGTMQITHGAQPSDTITFICVSDSSRIDVYGLSQVHFTLEDKSWSFKQDYGFFYPQINNTPIHPGWIVASEFSGRTNLVIELRAGRLNSPAHIPDVFGVGTKQFSPFAADGFEIIIYDPGYYFLPWSTSDTAHSQEGSSLIITEMMEINTETSNQKLVKFTANFNCKVYREYGQMRHLQGTFTGYAGW